MKRDVTVLDALRMMSRQKTEEAWIKFHDSAALVGAVSCLAQVPEITDTVAQVKCLFDRFKDQEPHFLNIAWAWLAHCLEQKKSVRLPRDEKWVTLLFVNRANFIGGPGLVVKFLTQTEA